MCKNSFCAVCIAGLLCALSILPLAAYGENTKELRFGTWTEPNIDPHYHWTGTEVAYATHLFGRLVQ
ncbi:hypothetical protein QUF80_08870 [Desulfococcaceae bacterium HSG8]|nr:hypothetical protein [Desulfococcaceae bacterium HSG8]